MTSLLTPSFTGEAELIAGIKSGESAAFEHLVKLHGGQMLSVARRFMRCEQDANDALQDALICVFRKADSFEETSRLSTWLHRITVNACLMKLRSSGDGMRSTSMSCCQRLMRLATTRATLPPGRMNLHREPNAQSFASRFLPASINSPKPIEPFCSFATSKRWTPMKWRGFGHYGQLRQDTFASGPPGVANPLVAHVFERETLMNAAASDLD